jgi:hypothetical protein
VLRDVGVDVGAESGAVEFPASVFGSGASGRAVEELALDEDTEPEACSADIDAGSARVELSNRPISCD